MSGYWLGVDLGGTKILSGLFDDNLKLLARSKQPTSADGGPSGVFARIVQGVEAVLREANVEAGQVRGMAKYADELSDVHALGIILYQLLTGRHPFAVAGRSVMLQLLKDTPPRPDVFTPGVPRGTMRQDSPCLPPASRSVRATTTLRSAPCRSQPPEFDGQYLRPLIT